LRKRQSVISTNNRFRFCDDSQERILSVNSVLRAKGAAMQNIFRITAPFYA